MWRVALQEQLLPWALDGIELGDDVLEIGPGPGLTTDWLRQRVARLTAIEIDAQLASSLAQRMTGTNVLVVGADATRMPFPNCSFSAVVALTMLHHVPSASLQDQLFAEVHRTLRPHGIFVGMDNTRTLPFRAIHIGDTMVTVDPQTLGARLLHAGFASPTIDATRRRFRFRATRL